MSAHFLLWAFCGTISSHLVGWRLAQVLWFSSHSSIMKSLTNTLQNIKIVYKFHFRNKFVYSSRVIMTSYLFKVIIFFSPNLSPEMGKGRPGRFLLFSSFAYLAFLHPSSTTLHLVRDTKCIIWLIWEGIDTPWAWQVCKQIHPS